MATLAERSQALTASVDIASAGLARIRCWTAIVTGVRPARSAALVVSRHPAFFIGALNASPFDADDYEGLICDQPLR